MAYRRTELKDFLHDNPVLRIMQLELIGSLHGPVQPPSSTTNKLDAAMDLLRLLEEAGFTAGAFDADDLFRLEFDANQITAAALFNLSKPLVGERPAAKAPESKVTHAKSPEKHTGSSQYASATSEAGSNSSSGSRRMSLGPSGAAMRKARSADDLEKKTPRANGGDVDTGSERFGGPSPGGNQRSGGVFPGGHRSFLERASSGQDPTTDGPSTSWRARRRHGIGGIARSPRILRV
jgi:hypothetical protein